MGGAVTTGASNLTLKKKTRHPILNPNILLTLPATSNIEHPMDDTHFQDSCGSRWAQNGISHMFLNNSKMHKKVQIHLQSMFQFQGHKHDKSNEINKNDRSMKQSQGQINQWTRELVVLHVHYMSMLEYAKVTSNDLRILARYEQKISTFQTF